MWNVFTWEPVADLNDTRPNTARLSLRLAFVNINISW
jgi:hypothetical protein